MPATKTIQTAFDSGKYSARMEGRVDVEGYRNACKRLENFLVFPQGGAIARSGSKYIANTKADGAARLIPFVISTVSAYVLEFGNTYIRFYKAGAQLLDVADDPIEIVSPYLTADLFEFDFAQTNNVMYITHPDHAPRKLSRISDTEWNLHEVNFDTEPLILDNFTIDRVQSVMGRASGNVAFQAGKSTTLSFGGGGDFRIKDGDIGKIISQGQKKIKVLWMNANGLAVIAKVIDQFTDDDATFTANELTMVGTPFGSLNPSSAGVVGDVITLTSDVNGNDASDFSPASNWNPSGVGSQYYWNTNPTTDPTEMAWHGDFLSKNNAGLAAGLAVGEWGYGDVDTLGFNTVYIRTPTDADPQTLGTTQDQHAILRVDTTGAVANLFRKEDEGKFIQINGGLVEITTFVDATSVRARVLQVLSAATSTTIWTLLSSY